MATWFFCHATTGQILGAGIEGDVAAASAMTAPPGTTLYVTPDGMVRDPYSATPDFTNLKNYYRTKIDAEVGAVRVQFITDVPGQAQTYEKKESEARLWTDGDEVTNPDRYPFMLAEAQVRGIAIAQVRAEIMAQVNQLTPVAALMEAHRVNAKQNVLTAATLPDIIAAAVIPWQSILP